MVLSKSLRPESVLHCPHCQAFLSPEAILAAASESWPDLSWLWCACPACHRCFHAEVDDRRIATLKVTGAPGPSWEYIEKVECNDLRVRKDPSFLHCWLGGKHFEYPARDE